MSQKVIILRGTVKMKHVSKEGLSRVDGKEQHDDSWLHKESDSDSKSLTRRINSLYRTNKKEPKEPTEKSLYIDLAKGQINRSKLIRRMVQVRGKNGKIFTRMQWVDPNTGQPVSETSKKQEQPTPRIPHAKPQPEVQHNINLEENTTKNDAIDLEVTKKKTYDVTTQKGFIDKEIDVMSRDEKEHLLQKHKIQWKHNEHAQIDWKNAMMSLKQFMYDNPHHIDAGHLPKSDDVPRTPEGTDRINGFCTDLGREKCYELMKKFNLNDGVDPVSLKVYGKKEDGGDGTGYIRHMKNMMSLKSYLKDNPHLMDDDDFKPSNPMAGSKPTSKVKSTAQKGGNTIEGVLGSMSDSEKYRLMREHGIAESDPRLNPLWAKGTGDGTGAIRHMKNMMSFKKLVQMNPDILSHHMDGEAVQQEKDRLEGMNDKQKAIENVKSLMNKLTKEAKIELLEKYKDTPEIKGRTRNDSPMIDYMRGVEALRKFLENNPDKVHQVQSIADREELLHLKLTNKQIEKILRNVVGLTSRNIDYAKISEKGKEWGFGLGSFARIAESEEGVPVLSIVDTGDDGTDWMEYEYPMSEIRDFVNGGKSLGSGDTKKPQATLIPMHKRSSVEIERELNNNFKMNYSDAVGEIMKGEVTKYWIASGKSDEIMDVVLLSAKMHMNTAISLLKEWGVPVNEQQRTFGIDSPQWKRIAYSDLINSTKQKNANDYIIKDSKGKDDPFLLMESARQWTPQERSKARREVIHSRMDIDDRDQIQDIDKVHSRLADHIRKSTDFVPFDLFTDCMCGGMKFQFVSKDSNGNVNRGNSYSTGDNFIKLAYGYVSDYSLRESSPMNFMPKGLHPFSDTIAHEFAHAIDGYFAGNQPGVVLQWDTEAGRKYAGKNINCVNDSYLAKVALSNPNKQVIKVDRGNGQTYYFHKDEWMSAYEGRIYDGDIENNLRKDSASGHLFDESTYRHSYRGVEHWSENVARYAGAFHAYKQAMKLEDSIGKVSMDDWAKSMHETYREMGYGDDWTAERDPATESYTEGSGRKGSFKNRDGHLEESAGYLYHELKTSSPGLSQAMHEIFNRPDFLDQTGETPKQAHDKGDFTRKSEKLYILEG
jgi:hypothetical protein